MYEYTVTRLCDLNCLDNLVHTVYNLFNRLENRLKKYSFGQ